jgi:hypothetical protein
MNFFYADGGGGSEAISNKTKCKALQTIELILDVC